MKREFIVRFFLVIIILILLSVLAFNLYLINPKWTFTNLLYLGAIPIILLFVQTVAELYLKSKYTKIDKRFNQATKLFSLSINDK